MTLRKAKSIARHLRLTLRQVCSGDYRVNFRDGNETITDNAARNNRAAHLRCNQIATY